MRDLEDALRNSTFLLVLIGPVVCSILFFKMSQDRDFVRPVLGLVGSSREGLGLVLATTDSIRVTNYDSLGLAEVDLEHDKVDGILAITLDSSKLILQNSLPKLDLKVAEVNSLKTALLRRAIEDAARTVAGQEMPIELEVVSASGHEAKTDWFEAMLPNWLVFTAMSALMLNSAAFIEEKEQRTLLGVLTAPVNMVEMWVGKLAAGFTLAFLSTLAVLLGNKIVSSPLLLLHLAAGCLSFAALGILIGLACSNQSAANAVTSTLFMVIYLPLALQELSSVLSRVAALTPAYYLQQGSKAFMTGQIGAGLENLWVLVASFFVLSGLGLALARSTKAILPSS